MSSAGVPPDNEAARATATPTTQEPPIARLPLETVRAIIEFVQSERSMLVDDVDLSLANPAIKVNWQRCRNLAKLALVSRTWYILATQAMYEIAHSGHWFYDWESIDQEEFEDMSHYRFATDQLDMGHKLRQYGPLCKVLHIDCTPIWPSVNREEHDAVLRATLVLCSTAKTVVFTFTRAESNWVMDILQMLAQFQALETLHVNVVPDYEPEDHNHVKTVEWSPNPSLRRLVVDGPWAVAVTEPSSKIFIEHLTITTDLYMEKTHIEHPFKSLITALAPNLRVFKMPQFNLGSKTRSCLWPRSSKTLSSSRLPNLASTSLAKVIILICFKP
ncbi:hypothetical protein ACM66B_002115 [Microbotryomycetes sp. NB124-2]